MGRVRRDCKRRESLPLSAILPEYGPFRKASIELLGALARAAEMEESTDRRKRLREELEHFTHYIRMSRFYLCKGGNPGRYFLILRPAFPELYGVLLEGDGFLSKRAARKCGKLLGVVDMFLKDT